jgi:hypothetical protein
MNGLLQNHKQIYISKDWNFKKHLQAKEKYINQEIPLMQKVKSARKNKIQELRSTFNMGPS